MTTVLLFTDGGNVLAGISAGQTRDQCALLAKNILLAVSFLSQLDASLNSLDWNQVIILSDGAVKTAALAAQKANTTLEPALHAYVAALHVVEAPQSWDQGLEDLCTVNAACSANRVFCGS